MTDDTIGTQNTVIAGTMRCATLVDKQGDFHLYDDDTASANPVFVAYNLSRL